MSAINIAELRKIISIIAVLLIIAIVIIIPVLLIKKLVNKSKKAAHYLSEPPEEGPYIAVKYMSNGGLLDDGQCGWLDIECENGEMSTVELKFGKKTPSAIFIPLKIAKYRISYRSKSKAGMLASDVLHAVNESNGATGAFANAVFDAGTGRAQLSSVVVDVDAKFVMRLRCATDGFQKSCEIIS